LLDRVFAVVYGPWGVALMVLLLTGLRLGLLASADAPPVMPEEMAVWLQGMSDRPGYADAAPLLPWILGLVSDTCGAATPCLRLIAPLAHGLATWMMYLMGRRLFDARTGFWTALTYATLPLVTQGTMIVTPMALVMLAWAIGLHALTRLSWPDPSGRPAGAGVWLTLGGSIGLGLLAHPVMAVFALAALAYIAVSPACWRGTSWPGPVMAILFAAALYVPELAWHAVHDWQGYRPLLSPLGGMAPDAASIVRAVLVGAIMFGPVLAAALLRAWARVPIELWKGAFSDYRVRLLAIFTLPVLLVTLAVGLGTGEGAQATAPVAVAACLLVVGLKVVREAVNWLRAAIAVNLVVVLLAVSGPSLAEQYGWIPPAWADPVSAGRGWQAAGPWMRALAAAYPDTAIGVAGAGAAEMIYHADLQGVTVREVGSGPEPGAAFAGLLVMPEALAEDGGDIRARLTMLVGDGAPRAWAAVMVTP